MHDLVKATDHQLALTGTIAGGYASHFFYLLYRLDPAAMKAKGYEYSAAGERKFVETYGTIETEYEISDDEGAYNAMSRGRMIGSPRCKPGISPRIYVDFLLDKTVFLNLCDMSNYLPPLNEYVEYIDLEKEIASVYKGVRNTVKQKMKKGTGKMLLGSYLQFSLSYSDKPYNRTPILNPINGAIITEIEDLSYLIEGDKILIKERRLCEIVNKELGENRNVVIYCEYTGNGESNITHRLKQVISNNCKIRQEEVEILESSYPPAEQREQWMHEKAAGGIKIFITNPRCVKTGLDFLFHYKNKIYNFPTIINYQEGYDMFTTWQACRRHYRLNQTEECRTYFLVSRNTIQPQVVEMVASKQVATSAIQGQFSSDGLCAMARGVDPRIKLAQAVCEKSETQERGLKGMFDVLNKTNNMGKGATQKYEQMLTFYELTGLQEYDLKGSAPGTVSTGPGESFNLFSLLSAKRSAPENVKIPATITEEPDAQSELPETIDQGDRNVTPGNPESGVQQKVINSLPQKDDLFATFFMGTSTPSKISTEPAKKPCPDALWVSLAAGLTKVNDKKNKSNKKNKSGLVSIFKKLL